MKEQNTSDLHNEQSLIQFYDERYKNNYMDEWPNEKKRKIIMKKNFFISFFF